jgi:exosortase/archaeosortase family protein
MIFTNIRFVRFLLIFTITFLFFYYTAQFITGLAVPGGLYSPFVEKYFNVAAWQRSSLILSTKWFVGLFNFETIRINEYVLRIKNSNGIRLVYSCLGFGVMSFWIAYITASAAKIKIKIKWLLGGLFLIWIINVLRISMVLVASYKGWKYPLGLDHHTWFNIVAYFTIFAMMYFFENNTKKNYLHEG